MADSNQRSGSWLERAFELARHWTLKLAAGFSAWRLDAELAAGADPQRRAWLRARAAELVSPKHRRRAAVSLLRLVNESYAEGSRRFSARVPVSRDQIVGARDELAFTAQALLFADQVDARGVAMIEQLLRDGGSVVYVGGEPGALEAQLEEVLHHLVAGHGDQGGDSGWQTPAEGGSIGRR